MVVKLSEFSNYLEYDTSIWQPDSHPNRPIHVLFVTSQWPNSANRCIAPFVSREVDSLKELGLKVDVFVYNGGWSLRAYMGAILKMRNLIRKKCYDIMHVRFGQCGIVGRAQRRIPVVITYGGSDVEGSPHFTGKHRYRNYLLRATSWLLSLVVDQVIVVSEHLGRKLPRRDYHVIPSGVDLSLFQVIDPVKARGQIGLPQNKKLALFAGNPENRRKRYDLAVQACKYAGQSYDLELVVLTGKPSHEVPLYMNACDVLLLTSTNEGSSNVVKEALACNLPIVSVDVGDVRDRIGEIEGCVVCKNYRPEEIANALEKVLKRDRRLNSRYLIEDLDTEHMAKKFLEVYKVTLGKNGNGNYSKQNQSRL